MMREDRLVLPIPPGVHWKDPMPMLIPGVARAQGARPCLPDEQKKKAMGGTPMLLPPTRRRVQFGAVPIAPAPEPKTKPAKPKREKVKADPVLVAKARELRDRWLEKVNEPGGASLLGSSGKYEVSKALVASAAPVAAGIPLLEVA